MDNYFNSVDEKSEDVTKQESNGVGKSDTGSGMCLLSVILIFLGILAIAGGFILSDEDHDNILYIIIGFMTFFYNIALAVIVDACQKYRERVSKQSMN